MTIRSLWNHIVRVYEEGAAPGARDGFGHIPPTAYPVHDAPTTKNARPDQNWGGAQADRGPGEQQGTMRRWFLDIDLPVQDRRILSVISGTEAGQQLRIESAVPAQNSRVPHHWEVIVSTYVGVLQESSS